MVETINIRNIPYDINPGILYQIRSANNNFGNPGTQATLGRDEYIRYLGSFTPAGHSRHLNETEKTEAWNTLVRIVGSAHERVRGLRVTIDMTIDGGGAAMSCAALIVGSPSPVALVILGIVGGSLLGAFFEQEFMTKDDHDVSIPMSYGTLAMSGGLLFVKHAAGIAVTGVVGRYVAPLVAEESLLGGLVMIASATAAGTAVREAFHFGMRHLFL